MFGRSIAFAKDQDDALSASGYSVTVLNGTNSQNRVYLSKNFRKPPWEVNVIRVHSPSARFFFPKFAGYVTVKLPKIDPQNQDNITTYNLDDMLDERVLDAVRDRMLSVIDRSRLLFSPGRLSVAIHIRRGRDVSLQFHPDRYTPDEYYFDIIDRIRAVHPDADVHVFSSLEDTASEKAFKEYADRRVQVHLEDEIGTKEAWANMMSADVFVMAKSSFSYVPAMVNRGCVIYTVRSLDLGKYSRWVTDDMVTEEYLRQCGSSGGKVHAG